MKRLLAAVFLCVSLISCSGSLQMVKVPDEYKNLSFYEKKILIAPFSRDQMVFAEGASQALFDSLDTYCGGRLVDSLNASFTAAVLNGLQTINGISAAEWTAEQKAAFFQAARDTAAMVRAAAMVGKTQVTFFVPGPSAAATLAAGANMICYVQKAGSRMSSNNYRVCFLNYVIYDYDAGRIVSAGTLAPGLSMFEDAKLTEKKIEYWVTRFRSFAPALVKRSPFALGMSTKGRPVMFGATYSTEYLSAEMNVKVDLGTYDTCLVANADKKIKKMIVDSLKPRIKKLASEIKEYTLKHLSGFSNKEEEGRMKACLSLCGMVTYRGMIDSSKKLTIYKFSDNFRDRPFAAMIDGVFTAAGPDAVPDETAGGTKFILPIVISVGSEESGGWNYYQNPFPQNMPMPKPPIPRF